MASGRDGTARPGGGTRADANGCVCLSNHGAVSTRDPRLWCFHGSSRSSFSSCSVSGENSSSVDDMH